MCSVSWNFNEDGYELIFNRDEKWSRASSLDCTFEEHHPVSGFCARDGQANGTWLFTSETGLTLALFNAYPATSSIFGKRTRGEIALLAGERESSGMLVKLLLSKCYADYAPFDLLLLDDSKAYHFGWDGSEFCEKTIDMPFFLTSSSVDSQRVVTARKKRFKQIRHLPLNEILADKKAKRPEEAIYVSRLDGGTVSQTVVHVRRDRIQFSVIRRGEAQRFESAPRKPVAMSGQVANSVV